MSTEEKAKVMNEDAIKEIEELEESASHSGDDFQYEPVPEGKRQNWYDLVFVWFGAAMVAQLYQAGVTVTIGTGGLPNGLKAILGGALFLALFTALSGYVGYKTHCNAALSSRFAYGSVGVAIPGFHIADIGWYVVNAAMFCSILVTLFPAIDIKVWAILISVLFITNNYVGFSKMVILNRFAFPVLLFTGLFGIWKCAQMPGGLGGIWENVFPQTMSVSAGITVVVGTWAAGCSRAADYMRFAKDAKSSFLASFLGFFFGFCLCIICGAVWGAATGTSVIADTLSMLGMVGLGCLMFFLQNWATCEHSSYITSTSLPITIEVVTKKRIPRRFIVLGVGIIAVCIAGLDIQSYYVPFCSFLGYLIPPIAAVSIADYFIMSKTKYHWTGHKNYYDMNVNSEDVMHHKFNWATVPALIVGLLMGWKMTWGVASINAFIGTIVVYCVFCMIFYFMGFQKKEVALNEALAGRK
ncbi:cytosine permease [Massilistercora timonensis]|uniref:purine-cytosine permease family protein n=1 Tax=Massilistercora timonensis TaxID=2086584 RepID=UPI003208A9F9